MKILEQVVKREDLAQSENIFDGPMVKAAVDVQKGLIAIDADLHADLEKKLLETGSEQDAVWGINLWYEDPDDFIEYDSMINVRPRQGNRSRDVEDEGTREQIVQVVAKWIR